VGLLLEILLLALLLSIPVALLLWELRVRQRVARAVWHAETRGLPEGGWAVELRCEGEPPQTVARLPAGLPHEEFAERLAEAEAEAEADAAVLNSGRALRRRRE
jgi:hypothetical protein